MTKQEYLSVSADIKNQHLMYRIVMLFFCIICVSALLAFEQPFIMHATETIEKMDLIDWITLLLLFLLGFYFGIQGFAGKESTKIQLKKLKESYEKEESVEVALSKYEFQDLF